MDKTKIFATADKAALKGQNDKAIEALEQILRADSQDIKALGKVAELYLKVSQRDKAVDALKRVGKIFTKDGFYSKAIAILKRVLKLEEGGNKDTQIGTHEQLAHLYGQLGLVSDAMSHFKIVIDHYDQTQNREALLDALRQVSDLDPNNIESQIKLAELFGAQERLDDAKETFERLRDGLQLKGSLQDTILLFDRWCAVFPKEIDPLKQLVQAYVKSGDPKKALTRLQSAFRQDPYNAEVLELLSSTFLSMKQADKARAVDAELVKIYSKNGDKDRLKIVQSRLDGPRPLSESKPKPAPEKAKSVELKQEAIDPAESLLSQTQIEADEKKILSECEVYLKYGLAEKAREVLTAQLKRFPKSLPLRWKLKSVLQELKATDELEHALNEIKLIADEKGMREWSQLAAAELQGLGVSSKSKAAPVDPMEVLDGTSDGSGMILVDSGLAETLNEESEISIIVEEDFVSELQDQPDFVEEEKAEKEAPVEEASDGESGAEFLLTESDFSQDELQKLSANLVSDVAPVEDAPLELQMNSEEPQEEKEDSAIVLQETVSEVSETSGETLGDAEFEIKQGLEEIEFFQAQGLKDEADRLLASLKKKFPDAPYWKSEKKPAAMKPANDQLRKKNVELEALGAKMHLQVQEDEREDGEDFFDLAAELDAELANVDPATNNNPAEVKDVFEAFKKGVASSISADDFQTHFDLGIAYREMGLIDDAINEFELCAKIEGKKVTSYYQMGVCEVARENFEVAKKLFDEALKDPSLNDQEKLSLSYELGDVLIRLKDEKRAKKLFETVQKLDPEFRDVQERLQALKA